MHWWQRVNPFYRLRKLSERLDEESKVRRGLAVMHETTRAELESLTRRHENLMAQVLRMESKLEVFAPCDTCGTVIFTGHSGAKKINGGKAGEPKEFHWVCATCFHACRSRYAVAK